MPLYASSSLCHCSTPSLLNGFYCGTVILERDSNFNLSDGERERGRQNMLLQYASSSLCLSSPFLFEWTHLQYCNSTRVRYFYIVKLNQFYCSLSVKKKVQKSLARFGFFLFFFFSLFLALCVLPCSSSPSSLFFPIASRLCAPLPAISCCGCCWLASVCTGLQMTGERERKQ